MTARVLALAAVIAASLPLAMASCTSNVRIGDTKPAPDPQCVNAACNTPCVISGCMAGETACAAPSLAGYCDPDGYCVSDLPACPPPGPCAGMPCGAMCNPCAPQQPNDTPCAVPDPSAGAYQCDGMGSCVPAELVCMCNGAGCPPPWDPCAGKPCGAACSPCDPSDPTCPPPMQMMVCDAMSVCVPAMPGVCPPPFMPCAQKPCGAMCTLCPPMDPTCMEPPGPKACDPSGTCVMAGSEMCASDAGAGDAGAPEGGMPGP